MTRHLAYVYIALLQGLKLIAAFKCPNANAAELLISTPYYATPTITHQNNTQQTAESHIMATADSTLPIGDEIVNDKLPSGLEDDITTSEEMPQEEYLAGDEGVHMATDTQPGSDDATEHRKMMHYLLFMFIRHAPVTNEQGLNVLSNFLESLVNPEQYDIQEYKTNDPEARPIIKVDFHSRPAFHFVRAALLDPRRQPMDLLSVFHYHLSRFYPYDVPVRIRIRRNLTYKRPYYGYRPRRTYRPPPRYPNYQGYAPPHPPQMPIQPIGMFPNMNQLPPMEPLQHRNPLMNLYPT